MTAHGKRILIAQVAIAILILPSSAFVVYNGSGEDPDGGAMSPPVPPPDTVYIYAIGATISNATYGFSQTISIEKNPSLELRVTPGMDIHLSATGYHDFRDLPMLGRGATFGIYENGNPVSREVNVAFGSRIVRYEYVANETRTFDIRISVNERSELQDEKHMTVYVFPDGYNVTALADPGGNIPPAGPVFVNALNAQRFALPLLTEIRSRM